MKTLNKLFAVGAIAAAAFVSTQAQAVPFAFEAVGGFDQSATSWSDSIADGDFQVEFADACVDGGIANCADADLFATLNWSDNDFPQSGLDYLGLTGNLNLGVNLLETLTHRNIAISDGDYPAFVDTTLVTSFGATDANGDQVVDTNITINFTETLNANPCENPLGAACADKFDYSIEAFDELVLTDAMGKEYLLEFVLAAADDADTLIIPTDGFNGTIWTAEGGESVVNVLGVLHRIPEPAMLGLFGLGLAGLGFSARRGKKQSV